MHGGKSNMYGGKSDICVSYKLSIHGVTLAPYYELVSDTMFIVIRCLTSFMLLRCLLKCALHDQARFQTTLDRGHIDIVDKWYVTLAPHGGARVTCLGTSTNYVNTRKWLC